MWAGGPRPATWGEDGELPDPRAVGGGGERLVGEQQEELKGRCMPKPRGNSVVFIFSTCLVPSNTESINGSKSHVIGISDYQTRKSRERLSPVGTGLSPTGAGLCQDKSVFLWARSWFILFHYLYFLFMLPPYFF